MTRSAVPEILTLPLLAHRKADTPISRVSRVERSPRRRFLVLAWPKGRFSLTIKNINKTVSYIYFFAVIHCASTGCRSFLAGACFFIIAPVTGNSPVCS